MNKIRILYIDDEVNNLNSFKASFRKIYDIYVADSAAVGLDILNEKEIDILLVDQRMPTMTGVEFLESIAENFPDVIKILITGYIDIEILINAINKGHIYRYLSKPWNDEELKVYVNQAYELLTIKRENTQLIKNLLQINKQLEFLLRQKTD